MTKDMTSGAITPLLIKFTIPLVLGNLFQLTYNAADSIIVGKFVGEDALAAVGTSNPLMTLAILFINGMCLGAGILVSTAFGAGDTQLVERQVSTTAIAGTVFSLSFSALCVLLADPLLRLLQVPAAILPIAVNYLRIVFAGLIFTFFYNFLAATMRALGDSKSPIIFLAISSAINIGLDLLLIIVFRMGVDGAALATVVSQGVSGVISIIYIKKKFDILAMEKGDWKLERHLAGKLTGVGIPMGLQYSITGIGSVILQTAVNGLGSIYVASMTAGSKINIFLACPFDALGQTMAPYAGQNIGARKLDRVGKGLRAACIIGFIVSGLMVIVVKLFGDQLTMLFLDEKDPVIMQNSTQFLIIVSAFYCLLTLVNTVRFTIQGMGFSSLAIIAGVMEMIARGIAGMLLVPAFGYLGACYSSPLAWLLADAFLIPAFFLCKRKVARQLEVGKA